MTRIKSALLALVLLAGCVATNAKSFTYSTTQKVGFQTVKIEFYAPDIVRVVKAPDAIPAKGSYSVIMKEGEGMKENAVITESGGNVTISSSLITVKLNTDTGQINFYSKAGDGLLTDQSTSFIVCQISDNYEGEMRVKQTFMRVKQTFLLEKDEAIFGLGQISNRDINKRGHSYHIWTDNTYTPIPYFTSDKGYGLYWDNAGRSWFRDNNDSKSHDYGTVFESEEAVCADYYFFYKDGTQDGLIAGIRQLTGQATMFPLWTMGHWQCRERYKTSDELASVLDKYRELQIPLDGIVQDWQYWGCDSNWNAMRFMNPYYINKVNDPAWAKYLPGDMRNMKAQSEPRLKSPEEMVKYVHSNNAHLMITLWPDFGPWTEQYAKLKEINALLPFDTWPRNQGVLVYDVFNPKARDIYWQYLTHLYKMGFDAWWTDSTEPDHFDQTADDCNYMTHDGSWSSVKNAFPLVHNKGIYDHQRAMKGNVKRSVQMTRSGAFGLQHYGTFSWSGDVVASWDVMKAQIPAGLNYTLCGIPFWNTDLGGFFYWEFKQDPKNPALQELQTRWMQWGTFMPLMRNHASSPMLNELYRMGSDGDWAYDAIKSAIKLRYRLLPYIYSTAGDCVQNSGSMMRALVMDFAKDKKAINLSDEYMFGRSLLVKPVTDALYTWKDDDKWGHEIYPEVKKAAAPVSVYLPEGAKWYDFWTNEQLDGGKTLMRPCPIDIMPVYVKAGTIIPFGPEVQYSSEKPWDDLEIRVYPGADGTFTLYEDEGDNYNYEKGQFTQIPFSFDNATSTLTIGQRTGSYKGMLQQRQFRIVLVGKSTVAGNVPANATKTVTYDGKALSLKL